GITLYRNNSDGTFADATKQAGLQAPAGELATSAVLFDADNDGLLDLLVTHYVDLERPPAKDAFLFPDDFPPGGIRFYRNNGDGTFTERTEAAGLGSFRGRAHQAFFAPFNDDIYMDLFVVRDDGPPHLFLNQGEGKFVDHTAQASRELTRFVALDAQATDLNHDGRFDLVLWTPSGSHVLLNQGDATFTPSARAATERVGFRGTVTDANEDGYDDLLGIDTSGAWHLLGNRGTRFDAAELDLPAVAAQPPTWLAPAWLDEPGQLHLVVLQADGRLVVWQKAERAGHWLQIKLSGSKSSLQGIGATVELKAGNFYRKVMARGEAVQVFAGDLPRLDVVRVTWPNAIIQNSVTVATDQHLEVRESERLASSCPLLYVWDGNRYVYLTEVLGVAPLGALAPDGSHHTLNPQEFVRLPEWLREQHGYYVFQFTDELREADYFDQAQLIAFDHGASEEVYANETYSSVPAAPALFTVRQKRFPIAATDDQGRDVLPLLLHRDGHYPAFFRHLRVPGVAELHSLTLDLGTVAADEPAALWLTGWVYWMDSNGARALLANRQVQVIPPQLQVRDAHGRWVTVIPDMGLPSGTFRTMRVDLTGKFLSSDRQVRIVTNLCVYWDQISLSLNDGAPPPAVELPLDAADLHARGFSTPISDPEHRQPELFDYDLLLTEAPWNPLRGHYTRYGEVKNLLAEADDHLVVMATGDELTVRFDARALPPLLPGRKRTFFLHLFGWAKDGEPNTASSSMVEPLPHRAMSVYPYVGQGRAGADYGEYLRQYQTRPAYEWIPMLHPPTGYQRE
ncbi:MAG: CRTAC1 family protein, partial [Acidobacteria bacterium]|nr:CRTAC1 family protein [Acidobacteriota bacterium]